MPQLELHKSGRLLISLCLKSYPFGVGRHPENDLALTGDSISNYHAIIEKKSDGIIFRDHSRNGTRIDGQLIKEASFTLSGNHEIELGGWKIHYHPDEIMNFDSADTEEKNVLSTDESETRILRFEEKNNQARILRPVARITQDNQPDRLFYIRKKRCLLGSDSRCDITIDDPFISREHLEIVLTGNGLRITDLDSRNGTFCDEFKIREISVVDKKILQLGNTRIEFSLQEENSETISPAQENHLCSMIGGSDIMRKLFARLKLIATTDMTVLLHGETGTGKEMAARAIHELSNRSTQRFAVINCAAIPAGLLESELFGNERGAFTGADQRRLGAFEIASGGTLFLDEIGELPLEMQAKILRVMEYQTLNRIGGNDEIQIDTRILAATHRNLQQMVQEGLFRQDLYYRLNVLSVTLPSLREHPDDIPDLCAHFLKKISPQLQISDSALQILLTHSWPGNIRELKNCVQRASAFCRDHKIESHDIELEKFNLQKKSEPQKAEEISELHQSNLLKKLDILEKRHIEEALFKAGGDKRTAASQLGIGRSTLYRRMGELAITPPRKRKNWQALLEKKNNEAE